MQCLSLFITIVTLKTLQRVIGRSSEQHEKQNFVTISFIQRCHSYQLIEIQQSSISRTCIISTNVHIFARFGLLNNIKVLFLLKFLLLYEPFFVRVSGFLQMECSSLSDEGKILYFRLGIEQYSTALVLYFFQTSSI